MIRTLRDGRIKRTGADYTRFRYALYQRANGRCEMVRDGERCNRFAGLRDGAAHHVNGRGMGGAKRDDNPSVCVWACPACHDKKHNTLHWSRNADTNRSGESLSGSD